MQDMVEKHGAILGDASLRNFGANVGISVCNAHLIYSTWFFMLNPIRRCKSSVDSGDEE